MAKWCRYAAVFVAISLLSLESDAQSTETTSCGSSALDDVATNQQQHYARNIINAINHLGDDMKADIADVKSMLAGNQVAVESSKQAFVSALECK